MVSAKLLKLIDANVAEENVAMLKNLKDFVGEKLGEDASKLIELIEEFENSKLNVKKSVTVKGKRKKSFYNYWLGKELSLFKEEQSKLEKDDKVSKSDRMGVMSERWKKYKESKSFAEDERKWKESSDSDSDVEKVENSDSEAEKAEKKKAEKEKAEKEKAEKAIAEKEKAEKKGGKVSKVVLDESDKSDESDESGKSDESDDSGDESGDEGIKIITMNDSDSDSDNE